LIVGTFVVDLSLPGVDSLKEKRRRIKPLLARVQNRFNVSIAEVGYNDNLRMAQFGAAVVGNEKAFIDQVIAEIIRCIGAEKEMNIIDYHIEML
jgi:uncharacterized protein YlxP (DUF503 family)